MQHMLVNVLSLKRADERFVFSEVHPFHMYPILFIRKYTYVST